MGNVYAKKPKCVRNREVTLFYTEGGVHQSVGATTTDNTGDWALRPEPEELGAYRPEVAKKKVGKGDKKLVCKAAISATLVWETV